MRLLLLILFFCHSTTYSQTNCNYSKNYTPEDLNDALLYLTCKWTEKDKEEFKKQPEDEAVTSLHFGTGLSIRNGWNLWKGRNPLVQYFNSIGIFHPDDMSTIILTSFHRQLNGKDIGLDSQIKYYQDYWNKVEAEALEHNKMYKTIKIGDTVNVVFSKQQFSEERYSLAFLSYRSSINDTNNCFVKGVVLEKQKEKSSRILTILVINSNNCDYSSLGGVAIAIGQKFHYNMTYFNLTRN